jgi:hypothetical protein
MMQHAAHMLQRATFYLRTGRDSREPRYVRITFVYFQWQSLGSGWCRRFVGPIDSV